MKYALYLIGHYAYHLKNRDYTNSMDICSIQFEFFIWWNIKMFEHL